MDFLACKGRALWKQRLCFAEVELYLLFPRDLPLLDENTARPKMTRGFLGRAVGALLESGLEVLLDLVELY